MQLISNKQLKSLNIKTPAEMEMLVERGKEIAREIVEEMQADGSLTAAWLAAKIQSQPTKFSQFAELLHTLR